MPTLRIYQHPGSVSNSYRIEVAAEGIPQFQPRSFVVEITFGLTAQEHESIRWYLEDFLQFDQHPAPQIARRVETLMVQRGESLFRAIFEGSPAGVKLWAAVEPYLSSTRIEIATDIAEATTIPWELIRDPNTKTNLALSARAFVRTQRGAQATLALQQSEAERVRILLVICRAGAEEDVPFRSVAGQLVRRLNDAGRAAFETGCPAPAARQALRHLPPTSAHAGDPPSRPGA